MYLSQLLVEFCYQESMACNIPYIYVLDFNMLCLVSALRIL